MEFDQSKIETKLTEEIMLIFSELGKDKVSEIIKLNTHQYNIVYSHVHKTIINRIKELEGTIENMKAIAGEKIEPINGISSVDYPSDNETLVNKVFDELIQIEYAFCSKCNEQLNNVLKNENYCPNCGRKILR